MKRLLVILNAHRPDVACIDFACRMANHHRARVSALLLESMFPEPHNLEPAALPTDRWTIPGPAVVLMDPEQAVAFVQEECARKGQEGEAVHYEGTPLPQVVRESLFADLIVLDPATSFGEPGGAAPPSSFTRALLREAHCPVLLAPNSFEGVSETVFCYDGSPSAIHAAKLYTYLLPELTREKATILEVSKHEATAFDEDHRNLMKWMHAHYREVNFLSLEGDAEEELFRYLLMKRNRLVVMGSFGRGQLSTLLRASTSERLIHNVDLPFFIAHL